MTIKTTIELPVELEVDFFEDEIDNMNVLLGHDNQTGNLRVDITNLLDQATIKQLDEFVYEQRSKH